MEVQKMNYNYVSLHGVKGVYNPSTRVLKICGINGYSQEYTNVYNHSVAIQMFDVESEKDIFSKTPL